MSFYSPLWKRSGRFWTNLNPFVPFFVEIELSVVKRNIFRFRQYIFNILLPPNLPSPPGKERSSLFKIFESGSPYNALCHLAEIGPLVLGKIFKICQFIFTISKLAPLWWSCEYIFESPFPKNSLCCLVEIGPVVLEKRWIWKCEKFTNRQADIRQATRKAHLSFQLRWAKGIFSGKAPHLHSCLTWWLDSIVSRMRPKKTRSHIIRCGTIKISPRWRQLH